MATYDECTRLKEQIANVSSFDAGKAREAMKSLGVFTASNIPTVRSARQYLTPHFKAAKDNVDAVNYLEAAVKRMELLQSTLPLQFLRPEGDNLLGVLLSKLSTELDWNLGQALQVARPIQHIRNFTASMLEQIVRADVIVQSNVLVDYVRQLNKAHNLNLSAGERAYVAYRAIEVGVLDPAKKVFTIASPTMAIQADNLAKFNAWKAEMLQYGLTNNEVNRLISLAMNVHDAADKPRRLAQAVGIDIPTLEGLGWLHRTYSAPMQRYFDDFSTDFIFDTGADETQISLKTLLTAPRKTNKFLVQDKVALATVLGLTPANHIFIPQTNKVYTIPWNTVQRTNTPNTFRTTPTGLSSFKRSNPHLRVEDTNFNNVSELRDAVKTNERTLKRQDVYANYNKSNAHTLLPEINEKAVLTADGIIVADTSVDLSAIGITPTQGFTRLKPNEVRALQRAGLTRPTNWKEWFLSKYRPTVDNAAISRYANNADFISIKGNNKPELMPLTNANYTLTESYRWSAGRANDLNNFRFVRDSYKNTVPVVATSKDGLTALARYAKRSIGNGPGTTSLINDVNTALANKDEAALIALAGAHSSDNGLIVEFKKTGEYALFDFNKVPDLTDTSGLALVDKLFDPEYAYGLIDFLRDINLPQSDYIFRTLLDSGILTKVPMSVNETFEYFVNRYRLPFQHPSQMVNMDFNEIWLDTAHKLKTAIANSLILTKLFDNDEAINMGWLVPSEVVNRNPSQYSDYAKVGADQALVDLLINLGYESQVREITNMHMHPMVARKLKGIISAYSNPGIVSNLGTWAHNYLGTWTKALLTFVSGPTSYILNNVIDPAIASFTNGGDIASLPMRNTDIFKYLQTGNLDHIDNITPKYLHPDTKQPITAREATQLFLDMQFHGTASNVPDVQVGTVTTRRKRDLVSDAWDSLVGWQDMAWHMMRWSMHSGKQRGLTKSMARAAQALYTIGADATNNLFAPQAIIATIGDKTVQLNHFLGLLEPVQYANEIAARRRMTSMGFFDGYAKNSEDLWDKMDTAFVNPYNAGRLTKALSYVGLPMFATYVLKTPFNVAKAVARRPVQFYNISRAWAVMQGAAEAQSDIADFEFAEYQRDAWLMGDFVDPTGNLNRLGVYDNFNNWWNTFDMFANAKEELDPSYSIHNLDRVTGLEDDFAKRAIREITRMSNPLVKLAYRAATGTNPLTGLPYTDEAGDKRPSFLMWNVTAQTRDNLYDMFPFTRFLDNWNPGGVFGIAAVKDELGNTIIDGKLGWNNVERYPLRGVDRLRLSRNAGYNFLYNALDLTGFSPVIIDVDNNIQNNLTKLDVSLKELEGRYNNIADTILRETATYSPKERERMLKEFDEAASLYMLVRLEKTKWDFHMVYNENTATPEIINNANRKVIEALRKHGSHELVDRLHQHMESFTNEYLEVRSVIDGSQKAQ